MKNKAVTLGSMICLSMVVLLLGTTGLASERRFKSDDVSRLSILEALWENEDIGSNKKVWLYEGAQSRWVPVPYMTEQEEQEDRERGVTHSGIVFTMATVEYAKPEIDDVSTEEEWQKLVEELTDGQSTLRISQNAISLTDDWLAQTPGGWFLGRPLPEGKTSFSVAEALGLLSEHYAMHSFVNDRMRGAAGEDIIHVEAENPVARDLLVALLSHDFFTSRSAKKRPFFRVQPNCPGLKPDSLINIPRSDRPMRREDIPIVVSWSIVRGF